MQDMIAQGVARGINDVVASTNSEKSNGTASPPGEPVNGDNNDNSNLPSVVVEDHGGRNRTSSGACVIC